MIYLDNNATTQPNSNMMSSISENAGRYYGNPSSTHDFGEDAKDIIYENREYVASALKSKPSEIIFTSGGTESNSIVESSYSDRFKIISATEHSSIANWDVDLRLPVSEAGTIIDFDDLERILIENKVEVLVSVMMVNNETGVILDPEGQLLKLREKYNFILHVDAVQAFGKINIDLENSPIDLLSISGHKFHALKGIGALYVNSHMAERDLPFRLFTEGIQERGIRPGTENQIGILSMGYMARKISEDEMYASLTEKIKAKRDRLEELLSDLVEVNGSIKDRVGNTSNLYFHSLGAEDETGCDLFIRMLSEKGLYVSGKSACSSGMPKPSNTLTAMFGNDSQRLHNSLRISLSVNTTDKEIDRAAEIIREVHKHCKVLIGDKND